MNKSFLIENYPGFENISGPDLAFNIYSQVKALNIKYLYDEVISTDFEKNTLNCRNNKIKYKYLIIASGRSPRKLDINNISKLKGISYCALCDGNLYKNKEVIVLGGGNSALDDALYLSKICKKVTIIHRRHNFSGEDNLVKKVLEKDNIKVKHNVTIEKLIGKEFLEGVITSDKEEIKASGLFICIGYVPNSDLYSLEKDEDYIIVNSNMETSAANVYACGDIIKKDFYQLTTAVGEATVASSMIVKKSNE